jgi:hypothetical protein
VEYGGSGGTGPSALITRDVLEACVEHGYLPRDMKKVAMSE